MAIDLPPNPALQLSDRAPESTGPNPIYNILEHSPLGRKASDRRISR